jgi:hypothetical protein
MRMPAGKVTTVKGVDDECLIADMNDPGDTGTGSKCAHCSRIVPNGAMVITVFYLLG